MKRKRSRRPRLPVSSRSRAFALGLALLLVTLAPWHQPAQAQETTLRAPAVPLVTHDPYFSIWSRADRLTDTFTSHWTGDRDTLTGIVLIDHQAYRVIGDQPDGLPALPQTSVSVMPTRTIYTFANEQVELTLTFVTPAIPADLELMSTPITAVVWEARSIDGADHEVKALFAVSSDITVADNSDPVVAEYVEHDTLRIARTGTDAQPVLVRGGDQITIDWGYAYLATGGEGVVSLGKAQWLWWTFAFHGELLNDDFLGDQPQPVSDGQPSIAAYLDLGRVGADTVRRHALIGYDDIYSIEYRGHWLKGYWARDGKTLEQALADFDRDIDSIIARCEAFDAELMATLTDVGGERFALLAALAHRQSLAASKLCADANGMPLWFPKENASNGCIATTDVFYPQVPHLLLLNNDLAKATVVPILDYAASESWRFPFAPHDLGTYPHANGQVYGGGEVSEENQMPVEESGNMLLICAAICTVDGNADFVDRWWPQLTQWAAYLAEHGIDPGHQLSTDDFTGHLARNTNLSVKAILGMAAYARMAEMRGQDDAAAHYNAIAKAGAQWWIENADAGDHYRLTFDNTPSWSQKYNFVWQQVLGLDTFPDEVIQTEVAYYLTQVNTYGLPLDSRSTFTKTDWCLWTATLTENRSDFDAMVDPVFRFADETPDRLPLTDWYWTHDARFRGFIARPVIGGVFMPVLKDTEAWFAWARKAEPVRGEWAPFPQPPATVVAAPTSQEQGIVWRYTFEDPGDGWNQPGFDDSRWPSGRAGFGTEQTPGAVVRTVWNTRDIWVRREIEIPEGEGELCALFHHDEDAEVYIDGQLLMRVGGFTAMYKLYRLPEGADGLLTPGRHTIAIHCRQTDGGQYLDIGFVRLVEED
jgi:hypothetical protein